MDTWPSKIFFSLPTPTKLVVSDKKMTELGYGAVKSGCVNLLKDYSGSSSVMLTPSCTASLEMCALALDIKAGDEIILPSFTFVTTASAFALRGARLVFVDIRPDTLNIDENLIESAITEKTKAIVIVHYAGVSCEVNKIISLCNKHGIPLIEDAAQGIGSYYYGKPLGTLGSFGCVSFHHTKNIHAGGEGGAIFINDHSFISETEIIQEKGTNRSAFIRGEVDKYTWKKISSSYVMSEIQAMCLQPQLESLDFITKKRVSIWNKYYNSLYGSAFNEYYDLAVMPDYCEHNAHIFYVILKTPEMRSFVLTELRSKNIEATTHYVPLHSSPAGRQISRFHGHDKYTTELSSRLIRLPLHLLLRDDEQSFVIEKLFEALQKIR